MNTCFTPDCAIWISELMSDLMNETKVEEREEGRTKNPGKNAAPLLYTM